MFGVYAVSATLAVPSWFTTVPAVGSPPDLLRLLAVPAFGWAAYRDIKTRRVPNETWVPLALLGIALLAWEAWLLRDASGFAQRAFAIRAALSVGIVAPLGYVFWRVGGFGGADAKAIMTIAVLFPTYPTYYLPWGAWPAVRATVAVFSLTVLSNTVVLGALYPIGLAARNGLRGRFAPAMFIGRPVPVERITVEYGRLLETTDGFTRGGLDVDALRMYLRWRGATFPELLADPEGFRDPRSLPADRHLPGDGSVGDGPPVTDGGRPAEPAVPGIGDTHTDGHDPIPAVRRVDWWGAEAFLGEIEGDAYGTTPEQLREGLEVLTSEREVWLSPGIPFIVPMFAGLLVALTYGDLLFAILSALGLT